MMNKSYSELIKLKSFEERLEYLRCTGSVGEITHGGHRVLNQQMYRSPYWKRVRKQIILRDEGCDLAIKDRPILGKIVIHHINPITIEELTNLSPIIFNPENLITVSYDTHEMIHYGKPDELDIAKNYIPRSENDTCPWR